MSSMPEDANIESIHMEPQAPAEDLVVCVRNVVKSYGLEGNKKSVINGLNMTVEKGTIYGLLGSSGCGKTTLLTCIVGVRKPDSGSIWVLGGAPGGEDSGVPGPSIGYMPQELSLIERFTIAENLRFFGLLCGRDIEFIKARTKELIELLDLPPETRWAGNLSGGQKRRLSLAIALLHSPSLLILDEPTVGVDPLLRVSIWEYLMKITAQEKMTVIVTTHYIEEARQANRVGLMRNGIIIAEDNPDNLLLKYGATSLEEAFLKVAQEQTDPTGKAQSGPVTDSKGVIKLWKQKENAVKVSGLRRIQVIFWKLLLDTCRNPAGYFFIFILPILQITLFCVTIGPDPTGLHVTIVNEEANEYGSCDTFLRTTSNESMKNSEDGECNFQMLSCEFLNILQDKKTHYKLQTFDTMEEAEIEVKKGKSWAILHFQPNYTNNLMDRLDHGQSMSDDIVNISDIKVTLDMSNEAIGHFIQNQLFAVSKELLDLISSRCGWEARIFQLPFRENPEVYGVDDSSYVNFIVPGVLGTIGFLLAAASTGGYVLTDIEEGISERCKVCGMRDEEAYTAYVLINTIFAAIQSGVSFLLVFVIFDLPNKGSWTLTYILLFVQGISGVTFGLLSATIFDNTVAFTQVNVGYSFSSIYISGSTWPIEGMHWALQYVSKITHFSMVIQAFRSILYRGWGITKTPVHTGFAVSIAWIIIHVVLILAVSKHKRKLG